MFKIKKTISRIFIFVLARIVIIVIISRFFFRDRDGIGTGFTLNKRDRDRDPVRFFSGSGPGRVFFQRDGIGIGTEKASPAGL